MHQTNSTGLMIAGTASGVGKTTVALALIAAMRRRGLVVQPFKGGPDFLDTGHHSRMSGRIARNLDTWMLGPEANADVLAQGRRGADAVVVEGMMGLFDGKDGLSEVGSTAEIAKLLALSVVLVVDAGKSARSVGAVVLGFEKFDPSLRLAGVILNNVASERHFAMLKSAIESACATPVLGWVPREPAATIPERHLGLHAAPNEPQEDAMLEVFAELAERHLDMDQIVTLACGSPSAVPHAGSTEASEDVGPVRIGVARDKAFSFYYEDNLDLLREAGAEIVPFSPLEDDALPKDLDAIYLGGGYPELYAAQLSANMGMLAGVREFAASGRLVYAECGGMIYLSKSLSSLSGQGHPMAGVLPMQFEMTERLVSFGYVTVKVTDDCLLGTAGTEVRGHSFHYSRIVGVPDLPVSYRVQYSLSGREEVEGFRAGGVLASYVHLHFRGNESIAKNFVAGARAAGVSLMVPA